MSLQADARRAYVEALLDRLRRQYQARRPIFWELYRLACDEGHDVSATSFGSEHDDGTLSIRQLQRLFRAIISEHQG